MTERSAADEEILRLATADDEPGEKQPAAEKPKDDTLELGGEEAPKATDEEIAEEKDKQRSRPWSKRVDILTAKLREAERERDELRASSGKAPAKAPTLDEIMAKEPKPEDFEFGAADPDYLDARQDWKLDVRDAKSRGETEKVAEEGKKTEAQQEVVGKLQANMAAIEKTGPEKYEDFERKINDAIEARGGEPLHPMVSIGIAVSPAGADIAYRLATDEAAVEKIEKLAKVNPQQAAIAFGELEGQYLESDDDDDLDPSDPLDMARMLGRERARRKGLTAKPATVKTTKAPMPPERQARGSSGQFEVSDDTEDFAAFERKYMGKKG